MSHAVYRFRLLHLACRSTTQALARLIAKMDTKEAKDFLPLTPAYLYILIALGDEPLHGYGIMKKIEQGGNSVPAGSLYNSLKRLVSIGLISVDSNLADDTRQTKLYKATTLGLEVAQAELYRIKQALQLARKVGLW